MFLKYSTNPHSNINVLERDLDIIVKPELVKFF